jgi:dihydrofolate synthase/folylpolyglutamate synthase
MTYEEAREFIDQSNQYGSVLGLDTITNLLDRLGNPQEQLKVIHVAGTNGKGSTTAFIAAILSASGYRVGRYISPALFSYRERIQIASDYITEEGVCDAITVIQPICEAMVREGFAHPTSFEIETAMAMLYFHWQQVDFAVIEVGLGGRLDATNVVSNPICCVITSISMDHMQFLGDSLEKITKEKAGIIKKGAPVVTVNKSPEVLFVLKQTCNDVGTSIVVANTEEVSPTEFSPEGTTFRYLDQEYTIPLLGLHQIENAILAIETARILRQCGYPINEKAIKIGLQEAKWRGRFEILRRKPYVIMDGAHNEDAALQLKESIQLYFANRRIIFIMGVFADKNYRRILEITAPLAQVILTITPSNTRALNSTQLANEAKQYGSATVIDAGTIQQALTRAYEEATEEDVIIAFGSLSFLGELSDFIPGHLN